MGELAEQQISTSQAAYVLGLSVQRVRQLIVDGHMARLPSGKMNLVSTVRGYVTFLRDDARRSTQSAAAARHAEAKTRLLELDLLVKQNRLIDTQECVDRYTQLVAALKARVYVVPAQVTSDPSQRRAIEKLLDAAFQATADSLGGEGDEVETEVETEVEVAEAKAGAVAERS